MVLLFILPIELLAKNWFSDDEASANTVNSKYATTPEELDSMLYAYADSYQSSLFSATYKILRQTDDPRKQHLATLLRTYAVSSIYDIATNSDSYTKLLDMLLVTTVQSMIWIDENKAEYYFGENGHILETTIRRNRLAIWEIAEKVMTAEQLSLLDWLIADWRKQNPELDNVSYIRFTDIGESRGKELIEDVQAGTGLLAPISEATKVLDEARLLAERSFYYAKRAPMLYSWQTETMADSLMDKPEIKELLTGVNEMLVSVNRVSRVLEKLPEQIEQERRIFFNELDKQESSLNLLLKETQKTIGDAEQLVTTVDGLLSGSSQDVLIEVKNTSDSLNTTLTTLDILLSNHLTTLLGDGSENSEKEASVKPFDINEYVVALNELDKTITHMTSLVDTSDDFVLSETMTDRIKQLNTAAEERVEHATRQSNLILGMMFFYAVAFSLIVFFLLISYRYITKKIGVTS